MFEVKQSNIHFLKMGVYFGYPQCCIEYFADTCDAGLSPGNESKLVGNTTGFIPCPSCERKILSGEIKIQNLIQNRICKQPFEL